MPVFALFDDLGYDGRDFLGLYSSRDEAAHAYDDYDEAGGECLIVEVDGVDERARSYAFD